MAVLSAGTPAAAATPIGIIGGSGLYELLEDARREHVDTPYGAPSGPVTLGEVAGRPVAFLARHGEGHRYPAHLVDYRANVWALAALGVRRILAPGAVGSLDPDLLPGSLVVVDQVVDRTWGRAHTYVDAPGGAAHVGFADPYCQDLRTGVLEAAGRQAVRAVDGGTMVVINGPRFSSRAESRWHSEQGWSVVGMTGMPEASLAREQGLCYAALSMVTDVDAGLQRGAGVTQAEVLAVFARNLTVLRQVLLDAAAHVDATQTTCTCGSALDGIDPPYRLAGPERRT